MTYMHEHLRIDLSNEKKDIDCLLDEYDHIRNELNDLAARGLKRIVDMSCRGLGRDYAYLDAMEKETGIEIIVSTGFYKDPFLPPIVQLYSIKDLSALMIEDIEKGVEGSKRKAKIIGEIGSSQNCMTENEEKVFRAAALAHEKTNIPISTHTTLGTLGWEQLILLKSLGVDPAYIIIGHLDLADDEDQIFKVLDHGAYVEFDTIGKIKFLSDQKRIAYIRNCCDRGYGKQLLLSMDITRRSHLKANGGIGYAYLVDSFLPRLRQAGVSEPAIMNMLDLNPKNIFKEALK